jgi:hypothetical protein
MEITADSLNHLNTTVYLAYPVFAERFIGNGRWSSGGLGVAEERADSKPAS